MLELEIYVLHGFLGRTADWDLLEKSFPQAKIKAVDVFSDSYSHPSKGLKAWGRTFNDSIPYTETKQVIVGYSLGGRLALHTLLDSPSRWSAAVLISTGFGLKTREEKLQRIVADKLWAQKFLTEPWDELMEDWDNQPIFAGHKPHRQEKDFSRTKLAAALEGWSLGLQEDLSKSIFYLPQPILWVIGDQDSKYIEMAKSISFSNPKSEIWIVSEAGHRVVWQQSQQFLNKLNFFLRGLL